MTVASLKLRVPWGSIPEPAKLFCDGGNRESVASGEVGMGFDQEGAQGDFLGDGHVV